jgi:very-short-patch-repair endonuclease
MRNNRPQAKTTYIPKKDYAPKHVTTLSRELRLNMTPAETLLWNRLSNKQFLGLRFRRQHPIHRYIVDFYCHEKKFIIEVDGEVHEKQSVYDYRRDQELSNQGYHVIRLTNSEIEHDIDIVLNRLSAFIQINIPNNPASLKVPPRGI